MTEEFHDNGIIEIIYFRELEGDTKTKHVIQTEKIRVITTKVMRIPREVIIIIQRKRIQQTTI